MNFSIVKNYFNPKTILDIGANIGQFYHESKNIFSDSNYFLIEGNKFCEPVLKDLNVEYFIGLFSNEKKRVSYYVRKSEPRCTGNSIYREKTNFFNDNDIEIFYEETFTLDMFFKDRFFDLIKIDVQGSELDILKGGINLCKHAKGIILEMSVEEFNLNAPLYNIVLEYMESINFTKKDILNKIYHPEHHYHIQDDVLFINNNYE
jgi:FkbM family methyltransferase